MPKYHLPTLSQADPWQPLPECHRVLIYQLSGTVVSAPPPEVAQAVLAWSGPRHCRLPNRARDWTTFRSDVRWQKAQVACLCLPSEDRWALRTRIDAKGRIWQTDVGLKAGPPGVRFVLRLHCHCARSKDRPPPSRPQLVESLVNGFEFVQLRRLGRVWHLDSPDELEVCKRLLLDRRRELAVMVLAEGPSWRRPYVVSDLELLTRELLGLAHLVVLPARLTGVWERELGRRWSIDPGGARTFFPDWTTKASTRDHRCLTARGAREQFESEEAVADYLRHRVATELALFEFETEDLFVGPI